MSYESKNAEILALFTAAGKEIPHEDSDMGRAVQILQTICDNQSHTIPDAEKEKEQAIAQWREDNGDFTPWVMHDPQPELDIASYIFEALEEIEQHIGEDDFTLDFDGAEYRIISESDIWEIYRDAIKDIVEDCYSDVLNLDKIPPFIAVSIDWEQTAKNAYADGYGHTFSSYDGSEEEAAGYYIFRTN